MTPRRPHALVVGGRCSGGGRASARKAFGGAALCSVRPDGYVGLIASEVDEAALRGYLDRVLIAPDQA